MVEAELAGLRRLGATPTEAARIYVTSAAWLLTQIHGETMQAANDGVRSARLASLTTVAADSYPTVAEVAPHFPEVLDPRARFEYGLDRLLEGLRAELEKIVTSERGSG